MNKAIFQDTGGFPLETETLNNMQDAYNIFNALGEMAGNKTIVKGCVVSGNEVGDGFVYLDGELFEFRGAQVQTNVIIKEDIVSVPFGNGDVKETYFTRYITFGTGTNAVPWADFNRFHPITSALFVDEIRMFAGDINALPFGWHFCDGTNGTSDLKGQFIVGLDPNNTDYNAIGNTGGAAAVQLTVDEMPSHNHKIRMGELTSDDFTAFSQHPQHAADGTGQDGGPVFNDQVMTIDNSGGDQAHENRPPFYTLAYIQFKGI